MNFRGGFGGGQPNFGPYGWRARGMGNPFQQQQQAQGHGGYGQQGYGYGGGMGIGGPIAQGMGGAGGGGGGPMGQQQMAGGMAPYMVRIN